MTYTLERPTEQRFIHSRVSWQQFKLIQAGFADSQGNRLFYYKGEVEILSLSPQHEIISSLIGILITVYFEEKNIAFT